MSLSYLLENEVKLPDLKEETIAKARDLYDASRINQLINSILPESFFEKRCEIFKKVFEVGNGVSISITADFPHNEAALLFGPYYRTSISVGASMLQAIDGGTAYYWVGLTNGCYGLSDPSKPPTVTFILGGAMCPVDEESQNFLSSLTPFLECIAGEKDSFEIREIDSTPKLRMCNEVMSAESCKSKTLESIRMALVLSGLDQQDPMDAYKFFMSQPRPESEEPLKI